MCLVGILHALFSSATKHCRSDGEVNVCLLPWQLYVLCNCRATTDFEREAGPVVRSLTGTAGMEHMRWCDGYPADAVGDDSAFKITDLRSVLAAMKPFLGYFGLKPSRVIPFMTKAREEQLFFGSEYY